MTIRTYLDGSEIPLNRSKAEIAGPATTRLYDPTDDIRAGSIVNIEGIAFRVMRRTVRPPTEDEERDLGLDLTLDPGLMMVDLELTEVEQGRSD